MRKYLCIECRNNHEDVTPLLGRVDCVLKHQNWPTWGTGCCSVKVLAEKGAKFTAGVYKYNGCVPSNEPVGGYKIQAKLYFEIEKAPPHEPVDTFFSNTKTGELVKQYEMRPPVEEGTPGEMVFKIQCTDVKKVGGQVVTFGVNFEGAMQYSPPFVFVNKHKDMRSVGSSLSIDVYDSTREKNSKRPREENEEALTHDLDLPHEKRQRNHLEKDLTDQSSDDEVHDDNGESQESQVETSDEDDHEDDDKSMKEEFREMLKSVVREEFQETIVRLENKFTVLIKREMNHLRRELQKQQQPVITSSPFDEVYCGNNPPMVPPFDGELSEDLQSLFGSKIPTTSDPFEESG